MKRSREIQLSASSDALWGSVGWLVAVVLATAMGFCVGYWSGYGHITSVSQTAGAFCHLPLLWLGSGWVFVAYAVTGLAWRLPAYFESLGLRICGLVATVIVWAAVIAPLAERASQSKFVRF